MRRMYREKSMSKVEKHAILHVVRRSYLSSTQASATCKQPERSRSVMSTISRGKVPNSV